MQVHEVNQWCMVVQCLPSVAEKSGSERSNLKVMNGGTLRQTSWEKIKMGKLNVARENDSASINSPV
jgi:hypothetical protein